MKQKGWDRYNFYLFIKCFIFLEMLSFTILTQKLVQSKLLIISKLSLSHVLSIKSKTTSSASDLLPALRLRLPGPHKQKKQ